jgi:hypothetical protein
MRMRCMEKRGQNANRKVVMKKVAREATSMGERKYEKENARMANVRKRVGRGERSGRRVERLMER